MFRFSRGALQKVRNGVAVRREHVPGMRAYFYSYSYFRGASSFGHRPSVVGKFKVR